MFREEVRGVLAEKQGCKVSLEDCNSKSCIRYFTCEGIVKSIHTLYKKKWLEMIGRDDNLFGIDQNTEAGQEHCWHIAGKNILRAELRKGVENEDKLSPK